MSRGSLADWPYFARWHYRGGRPAFVREVIVLWCRDEPIGICVFASPAASLTLRSRYFGLHRPRSREHLAALNRQLWVLARVVLHPTFRGGGLASAFVRAACHACPVPWIETLAVMGHVHPFFERAGFTRVGVIRAAESGTAHGAYARSRRRKPAGPSRTLGDPVYYVYDNRRRPVAERREAGGGDGPGLAGSTDRP